MGNFKEKLAHNFEAAFASRSPSRVTSGEHGPRPATGAVPQHQQVGDEERDPVAPRPSSPVDYSRVRSAPPQRRHEGASDLLKSITSGGVTLKKVDQDALALSRAEAQSRVVSAPSNEGELLARASSSGAYQRALAAHRADADSDSETDSDWSSISSEV